MTTGWRGIGSAVGGALVVVLAAAAVQPASAESVTRKDPQQRYSQGPALDLQRARFDFGADQLTFTLHLERLSKKRTQVFGTLYRRSGYQLRVSSRYDRDGDLRVQGSWSDGEDYETFSDGVSAEWDFARDVVTMTVTDHLQGRRGVLDAYTVAKGALHGPPRGDYITARLSRG